jgi:hypothetical protein
MEKIVEFNNKLVLTTDGKYDIVKYVHNINELSEEYIELDFMNDLLELVYENKINIPHMMLVKYGIISDTNTNISSNVLQLLNNRNLKEGKDYLLLNVQEQLPSGKKHRINYLLRPKAFKKCLARAKNTDKYIDYYLLLEEAIVHYRDYQKMHSDYLLQLEKNNSNSLTKKIDAMIKQMNILDIDNKHKNEKIDKLLGISERNEEKLTKMDKVLDDIRGKLDERAANIPEDDSLFDRFIVMHNNTSDLYHIIRCQDRKVSKSIKDKKKDGFELINGIEYRNVPNAIHLWNVVKTELIKSNNITLPDKRKYNTFKLADFSKEELIDLVNNIFNITRIN